MSSDSGNWCLIESDPGVFTELIHNMGAMNIQVEELYSLDADTLQEMEPVYGLIFLFKWEQGQASSRQQQRTTTDQTTASTDHVYFAQQIIQNACATQAILSILMNQGDKVELGETLENLRAFSADLPPDMRGLALTNSDKLRDVHNSFVRPESFLAQNTPRPPTDKDDDLFHFVSYVPINGRLYELDGLQASPIDHGATDNWLKDVGTVIQKRMSEFDQNEIRFNLMAVIGDRRRELGERVQSIDSNIAKLLKRLESLRLDDNDKEELSQVQSQIGRLNVERADLEHLVMMEENKRARYKFDNSLRKHNFIPLVYHLLRAMAKKNVLDSVLENAKNKPQRNNYE